MSDTINLKLKQIEEKQNKRQEEQLVFVPLETLARFINTTQYIITKLSARLEGKRYIQPREIKLKEDKGNDLKENIGHQTESDQLEQQCLKVCEIINYRKRFSWVKITGCHNTLSIPLKSFALLGQILSSVQKH